MGWADTAISRLDKAHIANQRKGWSLVCRHKDKDGRIVFVCSHDSKEYNAYVFTKSYIRILVQKATYQEAIDSYNTAIIIQLTISGTPIR